MTRPLRPILIALLALALPAAAHAAAERLALAPLPSVVHAGETVVVRWDAPPGDAEELEILLSLDGGRTWPLRVSPELEARVRAYAWRVPDLASGEARLMVRVGDAQGEHLAAIGERFTIVGTGAPAPAEPTFVHEAGWWERTAAPRGHVRGAFGTPACELGPLDGVLAIADDDESDTHDLLAATATASSAQGAPLAPRRAVPTGADAPRRPARTPLRN